MQGSAAGAVCHVQVAQMGQQSLSAAGGAVGGRHVQRRLPELVSCVCLCSAPQQQTYDPLVSRKKYNSSAHVERQLDQFKYIFLKNADCLLHSWKRLLGATGSTRHDL